MQRKIENKGNIEGCSYDIQVLTGKWKKKCKLNGKKSIVDSHVAVAVHFLDHQVDR